MSVSFMLEKMVMGWVVVWAVPTFVGPVIEETDAIVG